MPAKAPTKTKAVPKKSAALPLNKKVNFKSPMVLAVIGLFVALGTFFILRTFAAANPYSCPSPTLPMQQGATGTCVKYLQWTLNTYFYRSNKLSVDGQFGPNTKAAVQGYQYASNTPPVDGVVTSALWSKLVALNTGSGGSFDPQAVAYQYNSPGIGHQYGGAETLVFDYGQPPRTVWVASDHPSGKAWFGPYRNMTVPSGAHGIRGCLVYAYESLAPYTFNFLLDMTAGGGTKSLGSLTVTTDRNTLDGQLKCIDYPALPGTTLGNVEVRVGSIVSQPADTMAALYMGYTTLSYY